MAEDFSLSIQIKQNGKLGNRKNTKKNSDYKWKKINEEKNNANEKNEKKTTDYNKKSRKK